jgi:hypothetical protein
VGQRIRGSLRAKFVIVIVALIPALMAAVTVIVDHHQRRAIFEQTRSRTERAGLLLAARSFETVARCDSSHGPIVSPSVCQSVSERLAGVCCPSPHARHVR